MRLLLLNWSLLDPTLLLTLIDVLSEDNQFQAQYLLMLHKRKQERIGGYNTYTEHDDSLTYSCFKILHKPRGNCYFCLCGKQNTQTQISDTRLWYIRDSVTIIIESDQRVHHLISGFFSFSNNRGPTIPFKFVTNVVVHDTYGLQLETNFPISSAIGSSCTKVPFVVQNNFMLN